MNGATTVPLGEIMACKSGSVDPARFPDETFDLYSIPAFHRGTPEVIAGKQIGSAKQVVEPGDVLLSKIVPHIRRTWVVGPNRSRRIIASGEWIVFRDHRVHPNYLRHVLVGDPFHAQFMRTVSGVGGSLLRARPAYVAKISIPLPPLHEQRRIAHVLDKADALQIQRRATLATLASLTESLFLDMFGDPVTNPKGWPIDALGKAAETTSGGTPKRDVDDYFGGPIPWVKSGELHEGLVTKTEESLTERGLSESSAKLMPVGTVLVAMYGATVGAVAILGVDAATNQAVCCIRPSRTLAPDYLAYLLRKMAPSLLVKRVGGAQPNLSQDLLRKLPIPLPPYTLQVGFGARIASIAALVRVFGASTERTDALFASLQHRAFSGEL